MRVAIALLVLFAGIYAAQAFGLGEGNTFGRLGAIPKGGGTPAPPSSGKILLVDGVSFILQTDGVSKICRAGGC